MKKDQTLVAYITSTLFQEVLIVILDDCTTMQLWIHLTHTYSQISESKVMHLMREFQNFKKDNNISILDYLNKIKSIIDKLALIGCEISDKDKVQQALNGLGLEYHVLATTMTCLEKLPTFENLRPKLLDYVILLKGLFDNANKGQGDAHNVLFTRSTRGRGSGFHGGRGRGRNNGG
jgi:hypothetical protein